MVHASRRRFLSDLGRGMIVASVGSTVASDLGLFNLLAAEGGGDRLQFGELEPLVDFLQSSAPEAMLPAAVAKINEGMDLNQLVAAAALANARAFGGDDYVGFHTLMALGPALTLTNYMGSDKAKALPVLKVLYRNSSRLQEINGGTNEALKPVDAAAIPSGADPAEHLRSLVRSKQNAAAESTFAGLVARSPDQALNDLLLTLEDGVEVHRVVLFHRAWDMVSLVGQERAHTMLRQSLRYCLNSEPRSTQYFGEVRELLPRLLEQYKLLDRAPGDRPLPDSDLAKLVDTLFTATAAQAGEAAAGLLADGIAPAAVAEAVSLTANQLVLRDVGRRGNQVQPGKPEGSVHGDSIGVHASDSAHAWRHIAGFANHRHAMAATILSAYQVAKDRIQSGAEFARWEPRPDAASLARVSSSEKCELLGQLKEAIEGNDQALACAVTDAYLRAGHSPSNLWGMFARYATSEDGALHAEKYFRTCRDEYQTTREAFRNRQLVALARVTASEYGRPAPGVAQARELLGG